MTALGPLDHIARTPLPWRTGPELTECGKLIAELGDRVVTREAVAARIRAVGQQRAAFEICMTCFRPGGWTRPTQNDDGAITELAREATAVQYVYPPLRGPAQSDRVDSQHARLWERKRRLAAELEAIAALVKAHREEFDGYLAGLGETVSLADRRTANRQRKVR